MPDPDKSINPFIYDYLFNIQPTSLRLGKICQLGLRLLPTDLQGLYPARGRLPKNPQPIDAVE